ncbi:MAG: NTP transferase domain-containing protein [Gemmatimonadota bacterium]|nr:NTP transferase domain-containing protein [Gemmatimonadota bacterium]
MPPPPPLTLVILAAGRSTRFGRLKQLVPIGPGGAALLDYALYDGALAGFTRFVLVIQEALRPDFDAHLSPAMATGLYVRYAYQRLVHPGLANDPPPGRTRPWGTGHAALAAADLIADGSHFAICNADDFYGREAYAALAHAMRSRSREKAKKSQANITERKANMSFAIGYPLHSTLSDSGGVSRGLCEVDEAGTLLRLTEGLELRRVDEAGRYVDRIRGADANRGNNRDTRRVHGRDVAGHPIDVPTDTPVCTNLWGFPPGILPPLRDLFTRFLAAGPGLDREFYLSEAMNELIATGRAHCKVLPTDALWLGVTFPGDRAGVAESLRKLVDSKVYPPRLWDAPPHPSPPD